MGWVPAASFPSFSPLRGAAYDKLVNDPNNSDATLAKGVNWSALARTHTHTHKYILWDIRIKLNFPTASSPYLIYSIQEWPISIWKPADLVPIRILANIYENLHMVAHKELLLLLATITGRGNSNSSNRCNRLARKIYCKQKYLLIGQQIWSYKVAPKWFTHSANAFKSIFNYLSTIFLLLITK